MRPARALLVVTFVAAGCARPQPFVAGERLGRIVTEGRLETPGGIVRYRVAGTGPGTPLLVVRGDAAPPGDTAAPLEVLADERPVISYRRLGCGDSDCPADPRVPESARLVQDLRALRAALQLDRVVLLGEARGAAVVAEYVLAHGAGVKALVLSFPPRAPAAWIEHPDRLHPLRIPTLLILASDDEVTPERIAVLERLLPGARRVVLGRAATPPATDEHAAYVSELRRFLRQAEAR